MIKQRINGPLYGLLAGVLMISAAAHGQLALDTGKVSAKPVAKNDYAVPKGQQPEFIVKFRQVKSFDGEVKDLRRELSSAARSPAELDALVAAEVINMESRLEDASRQRVSELSFSSGVVLSHQRWMATGADLVQVDTGANRMSLDAIRSSLEAAPGVEYVEFNARMYPMFTPNDTNYSSQWHYFEATAGMNLPDAWDVSTGSGAVVAVLDTGYRPHNDLVGNIVGGYDFVSSAANARDGNGRDSSALDEGDWVATANECFPGSFASGSSWHGTHVAGTVGAVSNNNNGVAGVAFNADIVPVRVLAKCGGTLADIADAIVWSSGGSVSGVPANSNPADVINMSLGGGGSCGSTYQSAINTAVNNGTVVVVAAGNENQNASNSRPANCSNVVAVAALDRQGNRANYSNFGAVVDVSAPGGETAVSSNGVLSTLNSGSTTPGSDNYAYYQGTSMATPHVAGLAALMMSDNPSLTPAQVESNLKSTARSIPGSCSGGCGAGLVDATAALGGGTPPPPAGELDNGETVNNLSASTGNWIYFTLDVPAGATDLDISMSGGTGDADLYVNFGSQPTTGDYDCRPFAGGNNESCPFASPSAGTYHIGINAYSTFSGVSLSVSYDEPSSGGSDLDNGETVTGLSATTGNWVYFTIDVPAGASDLEVSISGGTGDADLYVRFGSQPTTGSYACRPYLNGNNETCNIASPSTGTYHIGVRAYASFSGVSLTASYDEPGSGNELGNGQTVTGLSASTGNWLYYTINVPSGQSNLSVSISGGSGDADLYVRFGAQPTTGSYNCRPYLTGNNETCNLSNPSAGTWHIGVRAYSTFSGTSLTASY